MVKRASIRSLTIPHIVIIICSYFREFNLNLSEAILNILTTRIKCSTNIRPAAILRSPRNALELILLFGFFRGEF